MCACVCQRERQKREESNCFISGLFDPVQIFKSNVPQTKMIAACLIEINTFKIVLRPEINTVLPACLSRSSSAVELLFQSFRRVCVRACVSLQK